MSTKYVQPGNTLSMIAPSGGVVTGVPLVIGNLFVVPQVTKAQTLRFAAMLVGVHKIAKATGVAPAQGVNAYWSPTNNNVTTATTTGNYLIGVFTNAYISADTVAEVRLNGVGLPAAL